MSTGLYSTTPNAYITVPLRSMFGRGFLVFVVAGTREGN